MAVIVQNDLGTVEDADSYVSEQYFRDYAIKRGIDYPSNADISSMLVNAIDYEDNLHNYKGSKLNGRDQTTRFPSTDIYDCTVNPAFEITGVPVEMKSAQCEYAIIFEEQGTLQPNGNINGSVKRTKEKVDVIEEEVEYTGSGQNGSVISYPVADNKIPKSFICNSGSDNELVRY